MLETVVNASCFVCTSQIVYGFNGTNGKDAVLPDYSITPFVAPMLLNPNLTGKVTGDPTFAGTVRFDGAVVAPMLFPSAMYGVGAGAIRLPDVSASETIATQTHVGDAIRELSKPYKLARQIQALSGSVEFFGDSITEGIGLSDPSTRYSSVLAATHGFTELNYAKGGDTVFDQYIKIVNNHVPGRTAVFKIGYNDANVNSYTEVNYFMFKETYMASLLLLSLGSSQIVNNRGTATTRTGSWLSTTYATFGTYTAGTGASVTAVLPVGRFIGFSMSNAHIHNCFATVSVDGGPAVPFRTIPSGTMTNPPNGASTSPLAWVFDTRQNTSHTITVTNSATMLDIDFFFAFTDLADATANSNVIVSLNDPSNFGQTTTPQTGYSAGTLGRQKMILEVQQYCIAFMRQQYGAKITGVQQYLGWGWGNKAADGIHPDVNGHLSIADGITGALANGERVLFQ